MNDLSKYASAFNWITPAMCILQDMLNGPATHFGVQGVLGGPSRREVRRTLRQEGIHVWGVMYTLDLDYLMFSVKETQAKQAYRALEAAGIAVLSAPAWVNEDTKRVSRDDLVGRIFGAIGW